jgi:hypothetical protein
MRVELRTSAEVHAFEREMNRKESGRYQESQENRERARSVRENRDRAELRSRMASMSPLGRDFARQAIERNNQRSTNSYDPGFHLDAFNNDSSNRDAHRSERTGWKPRK